MTTRLTTTPLDCAASIVAYNLRRTHMAVYDHTGALAVWQRDGNTREWLLTQSWSAGPVKLTSLCWSPQEFGTVLCSGSADGSVCVWRPNETGQWGLQSKVVESAQSVLAMDFAPKEMGPIVAAAYADGSIRTFQAPSLLAADSWVLHSQLTPSIKAATSLSWRPHDPLLPPLLLVGTAEGTVSIWMYRQALMRWELVSKLGSSPQEYSSRPVSDVAWAPTLGRPTDVVAVAAGPRVVLWSLSGAADEIKVDRVATLEHGHDVWQVGWNLLGNWLAASTEGGEVCMWRPDFAGEWNLVNTIAGAQQESEDMMT